MFLAAVPGATLRLPSARRASAPRSLISSTRVTLRGVTKMHVAQQRRGDVPLTWSMRPAAEFAPLSELVEGAWGLGPFRFVTDWAAVTNALMPAVSSLQSGFTSAVAGGPVALDSGEWCARSVVPTGAASVYFDGPLPVLPGTPVTFSAFARGSDNLRMFWYDSAGALLSSTADGAVGGSGMGRVSATRVAPAGAVRVFVAAGAAFTRLARPAITYTAEAMDYAPGAGIVGVLDDVSPDVLLAAREPGRQFATGSAVIRQLGAA